MVLLIGNYAIKLPNLRYRYPAAIWGLIHNLSERNWWRSVRTVGVTGADDVGNDWRQAMRPLLCPVIWGDRWGIMLIMRRAKPLPKNYDCPAFYVWQEYRFKKLAGVTCPAELKRESFGLLEGRVVAIDYA